MTQASLGILDDVPRGTDYPRSSQTNTLGETLRLLKPSLLRFGLPEPRQSLGKELGRVP